MSYSDWDKELIQDLCRSFGTRPFLMDEWHPGPFCDKWQFINKLYESGILCVVDVDIYDREVYRIKDLTLIENIVK